MDKPLLTVSRGDSLNAWQLSAIDARYFPGEPAVARDPQNYKYINGFVDIGDLPCRVATWKEVANRHPEVVDIDGVLTIQVDTPAPADIDVRARLSSTSHTHAILLDRILTLKAGETSLVICRGEELPDGYHNLDVTLSADGSSVTRQIACAILHQLDPQTLPGNLSARKRRALEYAAQFGEIRMGTALSLLATGRRDDLRIRTVVEETLLAIEERRDCADFVSVPLLWTLIRYGAELEEDLSLRCERALLDFRYWVDEKGNDVMWFWSENHALCFHVSQLLAGQLWPERTFTASGRKGSEQAELAPFAVVAFGKLNTGVTALPMFVSGHYEPPAALAELAFPPDGTVVEAHYRQGYGPAAFLSLYKPPMCIFRPIVEQKQAATAISSMF